jgi:mono/diheme cytochrome c family protein
MKQALMIGLLLFVMGLVYSCQNDDELEFKRYYTSGMLIYQTKCQNCHGAKGEGLSALIPPLTDSVYLRKNRAKLPCIIKYGLKELISVDKKAYDGQMPANVDAAPVHIAEVLTYINNSFGNKLGVTTTQQVNLDLNNCN